MNVWEDLKATMDRDGIDNMRPHAIVPNSFEEAYSYFEDIAYLYNKVNNITVDANKVWYPTVSQSGVISWNREDSEEAPTPVSIKGPRGEQGNAGPQGPRGNEGPRGPEGPQGNAGPQGEPGPAGNQGPQGERGPRGFDGNNGVDGFSPVVEVTPIAGGHMVNITDANGTNSFNVMDGNSGADNTNVWYPTVNNETGVISWEKSNNQTTPASVNITGPAGNQGPAGNDGAPGVNGTNGINGVDGFSPIVEVTAITGGNRVNITDANGTNSFNVMDGINGTNGTNGTDGVNGINGINGVDGFSPIVEVTAITGGNRVNITDANGINSFNVMDGVNGINGTNGTDGVNGINGTNGVDGFSPVITITAGNDGTRNYNQVSITDANGTNSFNVYDGVNGSGGGGGNNYAMYVREGTNNHYYSSMGLTDAKIRGMVGMAVIYLANADTYNFHYYEIALRDMGVYRFDVSTLRTLLNAYGSLTAKTPMVNMGNYTYANNVKFNFFLGSSPSTAPAAIYLQKKNEATGTNASINMLTDVDYVKYWE